ncbi:MAG: DUF4058 family protein [Caldilinea sp. CFX5]|nr:DUF4058 family protein [Caldilinea sp. CFX5]
MPSPFPGMDPYIEQQSVWGDFHNNLASEIQAILNRQIRPDYFARLIPYLTYENVAIGQRDPTYPDVSVFQPRPEVDPATLGRRYNTALVMESVSVESEVEMDFPLRLQSIEVHSVVDGRLVTVIEILSPVNKKPDHKAYAAYQRKRRKILNSNEVHLLEIDLLRAGQRPPLARPVPAAPYYVMLSRTNQRPKVQVWPIQLTDKLPVVPVPLLAPDDDALLDLGAAVASVYERGAYDLQLDYRAEPPLPKLSEQEARQVVELLSSLRSR